MRELVKYRCNGGVNKTQPTSRCFERARERIEERGERREESEKEGGREVPEGFSGGRVWKGTTSKTVCAWGKPVDPGSLSDVGGILQRKMVFWTLDAEMCCCLRCAARTSPTRVRSRVPCVRTCLRVVVSDSTLSCVRVASSGACGYLLVRRKELSHALWTRNHALRTNPAGHRVCQCVG